MDDAIRSLARQVDERRYGKFRGFVADNADPDKAGRLKLRVPSVLADEVTDWALPCVPFAGPAYGFFAVPDVDAQVWVEFEEGDIDRPIWTGAGWHTPGDVPADAARDEPSTRLWRTPAGHQLQFDDAEGEEKFLLTHPAGAQASIDKNGSVNLTDAGGAALTLDAQAGEVVVEDANGNRLVMGPTGTTAEDVNGNRIEMGPAGVTVDGQRVVVNGSQVTLGGQGGEPLIKGTSFLTLFATHVHPTAMGPSGPPVPQGEASALSTKVLTG